MTSTASSGASAVAGANLTSMPYFREYLRDVVKPRVEAAVRSIESGLTEAVWGAVVGAVLKEQGDSGMDPASLRGLLEQQLGLRIQTRLSSEFAEPAAVLIPASSGASGGAEPPDVVTARRRPVTSNPLAQAVLDNRTRF